MDHLLLNGKKFYYEEIANYSFRNSIPLNGYEVTTLEFCRNWLNGVQEIAINTSGSTGAPKLITLTRRQMEISARYTLQALHLQENDHALVCINTEYIGGIMMLVRGLIGNLHLTILEPIGNPFRYLPPNGPEQYEFGSFVPLQLQAILTESPEKKYLLDQMKGMLVGGAPLSADLNKQIQEIAAPVYHTYGMTETASHVALKKLNGSQPDRYFRATPTVQLAQDNRGCLTITGELTNKQLITTNDLVNLVSEHEFEWLGRVDNTINSGGIKIQAEKVEVYLAQVLAELQIDRRSFITAVPDEKLGQRVIALLEGAKLTTDQEKEIKRQLKHLLHKFEVPKAFQYAKAFCTTGSGKIDKTTTLANLL
ncbi:AMP-binding protein [Adhaeribacter pallidiroseus]|uniref:O-succinylbenzoate--CoA ligase n=1 Tax=Adhaeribacter pallidiroseus TaxID=2072847 RepID=A0A369QDT5_9BACT|nr:AMP-binding protein [Adhaeribacter pallidiroseus]RDC62572.1 o-succinylbenzoate--CoA ligase [Adhaeribacter pallidiroseus]